MFTASTDEKKKLGFGISQLRKSTSTLHEHWGDTDVVIGDLPELTKLKGVGKGTVNRIKEILETGTLDEISEMDKSNVDKSLMIMEELCTVPGIGPARARQLVNDFKITSIEHLIKEVDAEKITLPKNIMSTLPYCSDLSKRIPRDEVSAISDVVAAAASQISTEIHAITCGSYRREKTDSGDVDILIYHKNGKYNTDTIPNIVSILKSNGLLVGDLSEGPTKYMGIFRMNPKSLCRRLDIIYLHKKCLPAALLYFTGSAQFNIHMRKLALEKNYTINEKGIFNIDDPKTKNILGEVMVMTEADIFNVLGVKYLAPKDREAKNIKIV